MIEPAHIARLPRAKLPDGTPGKLPQIAVGFGPGDVLYGIHRRCGICGHRIEGPSYQLISETARTAYPGPLIVGGAPGPMHKSCAVFSGTACPFFRAPHTKSRTFAPGKERGQAEIAGFGNYGLARFEEETMYRFAYWGCIESIPFTLAKELATLLDEIDEDIPDTPVPAPPEFDIGLSRFLTPPDFIKIGGYHYPIFPL